MPHDISIFRTRYNEFKTEINDIQGNNKYPMLFVKLILLNGDIERYTTPDENGNLPKMNQQELNALATKYDELINELTSIANSTDTDPAAVQMRYTVNRYIDIIRNDAAVLKSTNLNNPMDINEILDAGMSSVFELPLDAELTDNSPISVEFNEDELTDGTFIRTGSNNLNTFYKATEVFGLQQMVQQVKPVTLTQGDDIFIGSFLQNTYGFKVGDATLQSPEIKYTVKNFENPTIFKDISDAQAMDYILGVKGRKNNVRLRFDENQPPTLTGFTLDATSDIFAEQPDLDINDLGVISQSFYNFISQQNEADFKNNLKNAGVTDAQATTAWTRLSQLKSKVDADIAFFQNTAPGFTAIRHIRIVQNNEWALHTANNLSATHQGSYFSVFSQIPASEKERVHKEAYRRPSENAPVKLEPVIATQPKAGIAPGDQETVKLSIPPLSNVKRVGNCLSSRYAISYKEGNVTKPGFFTPASFTLILSVPSITISGSDTPKLSILLLSVLYVAVIFSLSILEPSIDVAL